VAVITGTEGVDNLVGTSGEDVIDGLGGDDRIDGGAGFDVINGGQGNDTLVTSAGRDRLSGDEGDDRFLVSHAAYLIGGSGVDTFVFSGSLPVCDILDFQVGPGGDRLNLTEFARTNTEWDGIGNPFALGFLSLRSTNLGILVSVDLDADGRTMSPFLHLADARLSELSADNFEGPSAVIDVHGTAGADNLVGTAGHEVFRPGLGDDVVDGDRGFDTVVFEGGKAGYEFAYADGAWTVSDIDSTDGDEGSAILRNVELARFGDGSLRLESSALLVPHFSPVAPGVSANSGSVAVSASGEFVIAWYNQGQVFYEIYDKSGAPQGEARSAFGEGSTSGPAGISFLSDGSFVLTATRTPGSGPIGRMFESDGTPAGPEFSLTDGFGGNAFNHQLVALGDGGFVASWTERSSSGSPLETVRFRQFDSNGSPIDSSWTLPDVDKQKVGIVALDDGNLLVVWRSSSGSLLGQQLSPGGITLGDEIIIQANSVPLFGGVSAAALAGGGIVVVYAMASEILGKVLDLESGELGPAFVVNTSAVAPMLPDIAALDDGGFVVAWEANSYQRYALAQRFDADAERVGEEIMIWASGAQAEPAVAALPDAGFVAVWEDGSNSTGLGGVGVAIYGGPAVIGDALPLLDFTGGFVDEHSAVGTLVGVAVATDPDAPSSALIFSLDDDAGGLFSIDSATGEVTVADSTALDFESGAIREIIIRVTDPEGAFSTSAESVTLSDIDEEFVGTADDDDLTGSNGADTFYPLLGKDSVDGLVGSDTLVVDYSSVAVDPDANRASIVDSVGGAFSGTIETVDGTNFVNFQNVEHLQIKLDLWHNTFHLDGGALAMGASIILDGGDGTDTLDADLSALSGVDLNASSIGWTTASFGTIANFETFHLHLTDQVDDVVTGAGNDVLFGGGGDDVLRAGSKGGSAMISSTEEANQTRSWAAPAMTLSETSPTETIRSSAETATIS
jgi:Ca2+-binding RTX toxin-like protein